jgi:hypothetical protein
MSSRPFPDWDTLDSAYVDEFGPIAPDVYASAGALWPQACSYASRILLDNDLARTRTLLLKAAAQVTRARDEKRAQINELGGYLFVSFKHAVHAELEKDKNRRRFEAGVVSDAELRGQAENVERRILLNEIVAEMDEWTRMIFHWRTLDFTFDEIGRHLGENPKVVRNRYDRRVSRLIKSMTARHK